jgi:hypothetical protein
VPAAPVIHRHSSSREAALVNAYLVETPSGVVAVDGLPADQLRFLMELGIEPVAARLGLA